MNSVRNVILVFALAGIAVAIYVLESSRSSPRGSLDGDIPLLLNEQGVNFQDQENRIAGKQKQYERAKEISSPDGFINTGPVTVSEFVGKKVILVDFWTYSCINCQRTTPYLNAWREKYTDKGLVILGIHTPEFKFEEKEENVRAAVEKFEIKYPVILDNDYSTWHAYGNRYWPRKYLIDIDGFIVYDHIGEGAYEETERYIQDALAERMAVLGDRGTIDRVVAAEVPVQDGAKSPETYFGASRNEFFGNGRAGVVGDQKGLSFPVAPAPHTLYLGGDWHIADEFAENKSPGASILYRYDAKDVFFVAQADQEIVVEVLRDGAPLKQEAGADVMRTPEGKTIIKIQEARLYKIIEDNISGIHTLELKIQAPGLQTYTFAFG